MSDIDWRKFEDYAANGVTEYLIVDAATRRIEQYARVDDELGGHYVENARLAGKDELSSLAPPALPELPSVGGIRCGGQRPGGGAAEVTGKLGCSYIAAAAITHPAEGRASGPGATTGGSRSHRFRTRCLR